VRVRLGLDMTWQRRQMIISIALGVLGVAVVVYLVFGGSLAVATGGLVGFYAVALVWDLARARKEDAGPGFGCAIVFQALALVFAGGMLIAGVATGKRLVVLSAFVLAALPAWEQVQHVGQYAFWRVTGKGRSPW
jgi:hypothetical protein